MELRLLRYFVAVAEERHFGRAAARLHMSQPPLSRAIRQLEADLGHRAADRSPTGVTLTSAGALLYDEARTLLEQADQARARVAAAGAPTLTVGTIADSAEEAGTRLAAAFRQQNRGRRPDSRDGFYRPDRGVRAGLADVAITRTPFERRDCHARAALGPRRGGAARRRPAGRPGCGACARSRRPSVVPAPRGDGSIWRAYWNGTKPGGKPRDGPVVRTITECLQGTLWNGTVGMMPMGHALRG